MTDTMRDAYGASGELKYFFENNVPQVNLWRGLKKDVLKERMQQHAIAGGKAHANFARDIAMEPLTQGFEIITKNGKRWREPDVKVFMVNNQPWVKGCRTTRKGGQHWGISLWDQKPPFAENGWLNFCLPGKDSITPIPIPPSLAITQDDDDARRSNHYSVAPKDDMPLPLFVQHLKQLANYLVDWQN